MLLGPSLFSIPFLREFWESFQKFTDSGNTEQNATDESKVIKERGETELSAAIFGRHLTIYKWPRKSSVVLESLFL